MSPSEEEILAKRTPAGAWTRAQLAEWGVHWPPKKGWKRALIEEHERGAPARTPLIPPRPSKPRAPRTTGVRYGPYAIGERHRAWPEWVWDGEGFIKF